MQVKSKKLAELARTGDDEQLNKDFQGAVQDTIGYLDLRIEIQKFDNTSVELNSYTNFTFEDTTTQITDIYGLISL